jgi:hypothetical protein
MNKKSVRAFSLLCLVYLLLPFSARAQCRDQLCQNLQAILDAAVTDFREYRANRIAPPDVSISGAKVPCQMTAWANNVPMLICYAQIPDASAQSWYVNSLQDFRTLQPAWHFKIDSPVTDHFVDAGPPDCAVPDTEGPYLGHCPLHLQATKQNDGTTKVYLWVSSFSSPYLGHRPPNPPKKTAQPPAPVSNGCDDLCQGLKKAFEARVSSFENLRVAKTNSADSDVTVKLVGATQCVVNAAAKSHPNELGMQYVCYWQEASASVADTRFRDLASRFQVLAPSSWSIRQEDESEELTGAKVKAWCAVAPDNKQELCTYISGDSVGLHIKSWN